MADDTVPPLGDVRVTTTGTQVYWTGASVSGRAVVVAFDIYGFAAGRSRQICDVLVRVCVGCVCVCLLCVFIVTEPQALASLVVTFVFSLFASMRLSIASRSGNQSHVNSAKVLVVSAASEAARLPCGMHGL